MKFAIIGAGFYGLHLALRLKALGLEIKIFEKESEILSSASGKNQFRLHLGFHYARNFRTRQQSRDGYFRFLERYESLTSIVEENYYLVPKGDSLIDFPTYKLIMMSSGLDFVEKDCPNEIKFQCGTIMTQERVLLIEESRKYFYNQLHETICLEEEARVMHGNECVYVNNEKFDYCIDCTWGHLLPDDDFFFESTILLYYQKRDSSSKPKAFTFVDGPLCSLYPTETSGIVTLSSVPHTPIATHSTSKEALDRIQNTNSNEIMEKRCLMEMQLIKYYPQFLDDYQYVQPQLSVKTKPIGNDDDRSCYVKRTGHLLKCLSGKIDNIFYAASEVLSLIGAN